MDSLKRRITAALSALKSHIFSHRLQWTAVSAIIVVFFCGYVILLSPPPDFPSGSIIIVESGISAPAVAKELHDAHVISHPALLEIVLRFCGKSDSIQAGAYRFQTPQNLLIVAYRIIIGEYGIPPSRITFPEGTTVRDMAIQASEIFPRVYFDDFISAGKKYEGYLFPDTYLFPLTSDTETIVNKMRENFNTKTASISWDVRSSGHSLSDIVTMASLVEKEARTVVNKRIVAGILWNRLELGMPLQVDAVFGYIFDRDTYSPSLADLKVDSPYNTYTNKGLPPGPICNPGLESIESVLHPTKTNYLYYLTGKDGAMHYAATFAGHQANREKYLY